MNEIRNRIQLYETMGIAQSGDKMVADLHEIFKKNLEFPILLIQSEYNRDKFYYKYMTNTRDGLEWTLAGCLWLKGLLLRCSELLDSPKTEPASTPAVQISDDSEKLSSNQQNKKMALELLTPEEAGYGNPDWLDECWRSISNCIVIRRFEFEPKHYWEFSEAQKHFRHKLQKYGWTLERKWTGMHDKNGDNGFTTGNTVWEVKPIQKRG